MNLNRTELKKIQYDFNVRSNRLLQADFQDYLDVLTKYITFLEQTQIIYDFIKDCGECEFDIKKDIDEIRKSYGNSIFSIGETDKEEIRNVFAVLKYIVLNEIEIYYDVAVGYSSSTKYQDKVKGFNQRFVMVLIRHIEDFLTKIGIDMGLDERKVYNITVENGQALIVGDNSTVTANNTIGIDTSELSNLLDKIRENSISLSQMDKESVQECLEVIQEETKSVNPKKSFIKTALKTLKAIAGTVEFATSVTALISFLSPLI